MRVVLRLQIPELTDVVTVLITGSSSTLGNSCWITCLGVSGDLGASADAAVLLTTLPLNSLIILLILVDWSTISSIKAFGLTSAFLNLMINLASS